MIICGYLWGARYICSLYYGSFAMFFALYKEGNHRYLIERGRYALLRLDITITIPGRVELSIYYVFIFEYIKTYYDPLFQY